MLLYIVRHGVAIDRDDPEAPAEAERSLTEKGIKRTRQAARGIRRLGIKPSVFISSPYVRAMQTAEIVADALGVNASQISRSNALLPDAEPKEFYSLWKRRSARSVMAFGHAPNMDELVAHALGASRQVTALKKAGMAVLELTDVASSRGVLHAIYTPKDLRLIGRAIDEG